MKDDDAKKQVGTSLELEDVNRIEAMATRELTSTAHILRKCVLAGLPQIERQILGEAAAGPKAKAKR
jgi:hypothetical protein